MQTRPSSRAWKYNKTQLNEENAFAFINFFLSRKKDRQSIDRIKIKRNVASTWFHRTNVHRSLKFKIQSGNDISPSVFTLAGILNESVEKGG